jgi:hypothetical protein
MKKLVLNNREYWYRLERNNIYILFEKTNYFYLVNKIIIDILEYLSTGKDISEVVALINKNYNLNVDECYLINKLKDINGVINE